MKGGRQMNDTITIYTYPPMFTDYENMIENENYDNEVRCFDVPKDWAVAWIRENMGMSLEEFWHEYTYDDTIQMYGDCDLITREEVKQCHI